MKVHEKFPEFYQEKLEKSHYISEDSLIVFDTNYLLDVVRMPAKIAESFVTSIDKVKSHSYIPYYVALEFHLNKTNVKKHKEREILEAEKLIESSIGSFKGSIKFPKYVHYKSSIENELKNMVDEFKKSFVEKFSNFKKEDLLVNEEKIFNRLLAIIGLLTGDEYDNEWMTEVAKDCKRREELNLPPGGNDSSKQNTIHYNENIFIKKYGDVYIWNDIKSYLKNHSGKYKKLVFVTSDGTSKDKTDLLFKIDGDVIGPRFELINEVYSEFNCNLYIVDNITFIDTVSGLKEDELKFISEEIAMQNFIRRESLIENDKRKWLHKSSIIFNELVDDGNNSELSSYETNFLKSEVIFEFINLFSDEDLESIIGALIYEDEFNEKLVIRRLKDSIMDRIFTIKNKMMSETLVKNRNTILSVLIAKCRKIYNSKIVETF